MKTKTFVINAIIVLIAIGTIAGTFYLADNNPAREEGVINDATDVLAGDAAEAAGREARDPLINTEQGNMLVFFFTLAGLVGGGLIGYYWRNLMFKNDCRKKAPIGKSGLAIGAIAFGGWLVLAAFEAFSGSPIFDPELGDVVLFIFISSGTIIGILAGYQLQRYLTAKKAIEACAVG